MNDKGKAAIITGGDSGIGRAVALAYAREGADVLISYLSEHSDAEQTVDLVRESGRAGIAVPETLVTRIIAGRLPSARLKSSERSISWLITQPTSRRTKESIQKLPSSEWEYTFRTNIDAMYYLFKAALPKMPEGGAIINTASI